MTDVERLLLDHWHAKRSIGRLMLELSEAKRAYELGAGSLPSSLGRLREGGRTQRSGGSPVERAAILLVDQLAAEVKAIEKRLEQERRAMAQVEETVKAAGLSVREADFVRLRYFENRSLEAAAQRLYCSTTTCWRIKNSALTKIKAVTDRTWRAALKEA